MDGVAAPAEATRDSPRRSALVPQTRDVQADVVVVVDSVARAHAPPWIAAWG